MILKERADQLVFAQGLAANVGQAERLVMSGKVFVQAKQGELVRVDKAGTRFPVSTVFTVCGQERFVSRGAYKLLTGLEHFGLDPRDLVCLDAGASTGGFTDCLLQHGARRVYAVDVGRNQLHEKLRADKRVVNLEGTNLRTALAACIPEPVDVLVADVSFISLTEVLPPCMYWLRPGGQALVLIKPQFELAAHQNEKGVVRDPALRQLAVDKVCSFCETLGLICLGVVPAAIRGPKGNQEFVAGFSRTI